ncbi:hypothetical protein BmIO_00325 [Borrelia miyamotoi]|nr:hypothetical protein BmIO_00325 [Borrelia miyamotoi]
MHYSEIYVSVRILKLLLCDKNYISIVYRSVVFMIISVNLITFIVFLYFVINYFLFYILFLHNYNFPKH